MPKSLNDILKGVKKSTTTALTTGNVPGVDYADKMKDGRDFVAQHSIEKHADRVGNDDTVYKGSTKKAEMKRHGHEPKPKDIRVYNKTNQVTNEEVEELEEADLMHIKVGEKVRLTNPKATPKHTVDKIKGDKVHITRDNGSKVVMPLNRIKRVKAQAMKLKEDKDEREYGYEGDMAITQLKTICRNAEHLMKIMKPDTDLPEWVQSKITKAEDYISTAHDYLMSEMSEEVEQIDELTGKKKKLFGKDPLSAVANRAINRMKLPPNDGSRLSPEEVRRNKLYGKVSRMAFDRMEEEVELDEAETLDSWTNKHEKAGRHITKDNKTARYHAWDKDEKDRFVKHHSSFSLKKSASNKMEEVESDEKKKTAHHKLLQKFKHRIDEVKAIKGAHASKQHAAKVINPGKVGYAGKGTKPKIQSLRREDYAPLEDGEKQTHVDQKTANAKSRVQGGEKPKKPKMELTKEAWELYDSLSGAHKYVFENMDSAERDHLVDKYISGKR